MDTLTDKEKANLRGELLITEKQWVSFWNSKCGGDKDITLASAIPEFIAIQLNWRGIDNHEKQKVLRTIALIFSVISQAGTHSKTAVQKVFDDMNPTNKKANIFSRKFGFLLNKVFKRVATRKQKQSLLAFLFFTAPIALYLYNRDMDETGHLSPLFILFFAASTFAFIAAFTHILEWVNNENK